MDGEKMIQELHTISSKGMSARQANPPMRSCAARPLALRRHVSIQFPKMGDVTHGVEYAQNEYLA